MTPRWEVIHGDCLDVMRTLAPGSVDAIVTDPPYCSGGRQQAGARLIVSKSDNDIRSPDEWFIGDNMGSDTYVRWMRQVAGLGITACSLGSQALVFTDWRQYTNLVTAWESVGWTLRSCIVLDKAKAGAMGSFWRSNHEWVCVFCKGPPRELPNRSFFNTWRGAKPQGGEHPTEKPVELMRYLVASVTPASVRPAPLVLDPFAGSGTTGVACIGERAAFLGVERDADYVAIARRRIADAAAQTNLFDGNAA